MSSRQAAGGSIARRSTVRTRRSIIGSIAGPEKSAKHLIADNGYDAKTSRKALRKQGTQPIIPGGSNRKRKIAYDKARYRERHLVENAFCRLKDFWRIATGYDKLAQNFLSAVAVATLVAFWV